MEYPWYDILEDESEITQGDILLNCPVPVLINTKDYEITKEVKAEIIKVDGIILTQACDIANNKVDHIIICGIKSKSEFEKQLINQGKSSKEISGIIKQIIRGQQNSLHIINNYKTDYLKQDYYIINLKDVFSVPIEIAKNIAKNNGTRLRLCPPYREHLSQAFARFFMRVGLPNNIKMD